MSVWVKARMDFVLTEDEGLNIVSVRRDNTEDRPVTIPRTISGILNGRITPPLQPTRVIYMHPGLLSSGHRSGIMLFAINLY